MREAMALLSDLIFAVILHIVYNKSINNKF